MASWLCFSLSYPHQSLTSFFASLMLSEAHSSPASAAIQRAQAITRGFLGSTPLGRLGNFLATCPQRKSKDHHDTPVRATRLEARPRSSRRSDLEAKRGGTDSRDSKRQSTTQQSCVRCRRFHSITVHYTQGCSRATVTGKDRSLAWRRHCRTRTCPSRTSHRIESSRKGRSAEKATSRPRVRA